MLVTLISVLYTYSSTDADGSSVFKIVQIKKSNLIFFFNGKHRRKRINNYEAGVKCKDMKETFLLSGIIVRL
jgi:hypothetical protein